MTKTDQQPREECRPLWSLILLHCAAAVVCFAFFSGVPIVGCIVLMAIEGDVGGPLFFPIFVFGVILFAVVVTAILASAALLSDLLRRHKLFPVWWPPIAVLVLATGISWLAFMRAHPAVPLIVGASVTLAFIIHWAAISAVWFLPRVLTRLFPFQDAHSPS